MKFILANDKIIGSLIILFLIIHIIFGKPRWQVYPLYIAIGIYFLMIILNYNDFINITKKLENWFLGIEIFLLFLSIIALIVFPLYKIPHPSGKYKIGTKTYDFIDASRDAVYSNELSDYRKIKFQIWYPTNSIDAYEKEKWIVDGKVLTRGFAKNINMPYFMLDHTTLIESNSYKNAPISNELEKYPIVIISHGWLSFREFHTDFAEELASNGYIAISIDHTYGSQAVKFENGDIAYLKEEALPNEDSNLNFGKYAKKLVINYGKDVISVLNELEDFNRNIEFEGKLDLDKIGLLGHSTGGGGDVYASLKDKRIKAVLGLDAWVIPIESEFEVFRLSVPSRFIRSNEWANFPNNRSLKSLVGNSMDSKLLQIDGTKHVDFTMAYMYSPVLKLVGFLGSLEGRKASKIQREFILNFFNEYLKEEKDNNKNYMEDIINKYKDFRIVDTD